MSLAGDSNQISGVMGLGFGPKTFVNQLDFKAKVVSHTASDEKEQWGPPVHSFDLVKT